VGGRVRHATVEGIPAAVREVVGVGASVVVTPELEGLALRLREAGIQAYVATRTHPKGDAREISAESAPSPVGVRDLETVLRRADCGVLSGVAGVASSGTVFVGPGGGNGGLLASLPPRTIVVLEASRLRNGLAEALTLAFGRFSRDGGELMLITGPSRTADIEMMSVVGVHGPLGVEVVLVDGPIIDPAPADAARIHEVPAEPSGLPPTEP
jgi:L-lactate utilization protein LutC